MLQSKAAFLAFFMFCSVQALMMLQQHNTLQLSLDLDRLPGTNHAARAEMVGGTRPGPEAAAPRHGVVSQQQADTKSVELLSISKIVTVQLGSRVCKSFHWTGALSQTCGARTCQSSTLLSWTQPQFQMVCGACGVMAATREAVQPFRCSAVQPSAFHCSAVQPSAFRCSAVQPSAV